MTDKRSPIGASDKSPGYSADAPPASIFALAIPDDEPLPPCTRLALDWAGDVFAAYDPQTGEVLEEGTAPDRIN